MVHNIMSVSSVSEPKEISSPIERKTTCRLGKFAFIRKALGSSAYMARKGMHNVDLVGEWSKIIGSYLAKYSVPEGVKNISGQRVLFVRVFETRVIEFQHQKDDFIERVNICAGYPMIDDMRFIRVQTLPKSKYKNRMIYSNKTLPKTPHPALVSQKTHFQDKVLEKAFHLLAHSVMPLSETLGNDIITLSDSQQKTPPQKAWLMQAKKIMTYTQDNT